MAIPRIKKVLKDAAKNGETSEWTSVKGVTALRGNDKPCTCPRGGKRASCESKIHK